MMHKKRVWQVCPVESAEELARRLTELTWTGCTGWKLDNLLFLNDATCADGAQEYAVCLPRDGDKYVQIESITFSWCNYDRALELIELSQQYARGEEPLPIEWPIQPDFNHGRRCHLCA